MIEEKLDFDEIKTIYKLENKRLKSSKSENDFK